MGRHGDARVRVTARELPERSGQLHVSHPGHGRHARVLEGLCGHGGKLDAKLGGKRLPDPGKGVLVHVGPVLEHLAQLLRRSVEALGALRADRGDGCGKLDGEVLRNGVEQTRVVAARGARLGPAHLDDGDDVAAKPHGHADEARERRDLAGRARAWRSPDSSSSNSLVASAPARRLCSDGGRSLRRSALPPS